MIEYINRRLIEWATWSSRRQDGGLGYPAAANFSRLTGCSGFGAGPVVLDSAAMEIERAVVELRTARPDLYAVAYWVYLAGDLTMGRVAKELGCHRDTVYVRLHALHLQVMDALHEQVLREAEPLIEKKLKYA